MDSTPTLRSARTEDLPAIEAIAVAAGMFTADEVGFLGAQFAAGAADPSAEAHWLTMERDGAVVAGAFYAPEPFADRMWNLYFIAVDPSAQGGGLGKRLMADVEAALRARGEDVARTLIVETSSTAQYSGTRAFYRGLGYDEEATVRQFYGPDDHKVIFWKSLAA